MFTFTCISIQFDDFLKDNITKFAKFLKLFELVNDPTFFIEMPQYEVKKQVIVDILKRRKQQGKSLDIEKDGEPLLSSAILAMHPQIALEMVNLGANVNTKSKE